jgi:hypothetical protein
VFHEPPPGAGQPVGVQPVEGELVVVVAAEGVRVELRILADDVRLLHGGRRDGVVTGGGLGHHVHTTGGAVASSALPALGVVRVVRVVCVVDPLGEEARGAALQEQGERHFGAELRLDLQHQPDGGQRGESGVGQVGVRADRPGPGDQGLQDAEQSLTGGAGGHLGG